MRIAARKVCDYRRRACREKRGGGRLRGESALMRAGDDDGGIERVIGTEPSPDLAVEGTDTLRHLFGKLNDRALQEIAILKLQGYRNQEIADQLKSDTGNGTGRDS